MRKDRCNGPAPPPRSPTPEDPHIHTQTHATRRLFRRHLCDAHAQVKRPQNPLCEAHTRQEPAVAPLPAQEVPHAKKLYDLGAQRCRVKGLESAVPAQEVPQAKYRIMCQRRGRLRLEVSENARGQAMKGPKAPADTAGPRKKLIIAPPSPLNEAKKRGEAHHLGRK